MLGFGKAAFWRLLKNCHSLDCRQRIHEALRQLACLGARSSRFAIDFCQQIGVGCVGEKLDLANRLRQFSRPPMRQNQCNGLIDERRRDRALLDRQKIVRAKTVVAERNRWFVLHLQPRAIAIVPFRRAVDLQFTGQLDLRRPAQSLFENFRLDRKLILVRGVLVVASATTLEVRAARLNPFGRRLNHAFQPRPGKPRLLFRQFCFDGFTLKRERDEHALAGTTFIGGQPRQSFAPINVLFDF